MTARRQENKGQGLGFACFAVLGTLTGPVIGSQAWGAATERVVVNRHSGLAIDGFDPVAFFTDAGPFKGLPDLEVSERGVVWRFRNEANRVVFLAHPEIYSPRFGGYDPVQVAQGKVVAGRPQIWLIAGERLYLFSREESREAFAADPEGILKQADSLWPALSDTLSDY